LPSVNWSRWYSVEGFSTLHWNGASRIDRPEHIAALILVIVSGTGEMPAGFHALPIPNDARDVHAEVNPFFLEVNCL
jgi:hypothetical protein